MISATVGEAGAKRKNFSVKKKIMVRPSKNKELRVLSQLMRERASMGILWN